ncbi:MAG: hypothetical protein AAB961_01325 [Patescibacteria group bacterium]
MTNYKKQLLSVLASGAVMLNTVLPVYAGTVIEISGNGSDSNNTANVSLNTSTNVVQNNTAEIENYVDAEANTGDNDANDNTGGDVDVDTGDATVNVSVANAVNSNSASVDCCPQGDTDVLISGNGTHSDNDVDFDQNSTINVFQDNYADIDNDVYADAKTGKNDANDNTGGSVSIDTGDAEVNVEVSNTANANWAQVGGDGQGGQLSARIVGNGSNSDNLIDLYLDSAILVKQDNDAEIENYVDADAKTGKNDANDNTGGDVSIDTGDAEVDVSVDNMVNFNWADVDCGCLLDLLAKIADNGTYTDNDIKLNLDDELEVFQDNQCGGKGEEECKNDVYADAKTGKNDAEDNTGDVDGGDPSIDTGNAETVVDVSNSGNVNSYGADSEQDWPDFDFNFNLSLSWEQLAQLLGLL